MTIQITTINQADYESKRWEIIQIKGSELLIWPSSSSL